jgi:hypothetical protein
MRRIQTDSVHTLWPETQIKRLVPLRCRVEGCAAGENVGIDWRRRIDRGPFHGTTKTSNRSWRITLAGVESR